MRSNSSTHSGQTSSSSSSMNWSCCMRDIAEDSREEAYGRSQGAARVNGAAARKTLRCKTKRKKAYKERVKSEEGIKRLLETCGGGTRVWEGTWSFCKGESEGWSTRFCLRGAPSRHTGSSCQSFRVSWTTSRQAPAKLEIRRLSHSQPPLASMLIRKP